MKKQLLISVLTIVLVSCKSEPKEEAIAIQVQETTIGNHIAALASDDFLGRMPFSEGETKTVNYLKEEFAKLGVQPGNGTSYFQDVPLVEITGTPSEKMTISGGKTPIVLNYLDDFVALTQKIVPDVALNDSELVFAGYGIVAPEYGWNDYEGIDWKGKTAVVLINDPGFRSGDNQLFKGDAMTYYGRWTYKYEEAARQGAAGILIIHETEPASYGWNVVQSSWSGAKMNLESSAPQTDVQGWISMESAQQLFENSSLEDKNYNNLAKQKNFKPIALGLKASVQITNTIKKDVSKNVVALIPGTDQKDEYIIYSAHWDHLGVGRPVNNDSIYNGAVDNASGTACLLAIAEAYKKMPPTKRSIVFIAVTAEEQGLLGSAFYAENPIYDPKKSVANINMDALASPGPMKDLTITGFGHSEMDEYAKTAAEQQGRYIIPDPDAEKGYFFRSDHFNFAKIGIPALYASGSHEDFQYGVDYVKKMKEEYQKNKYHQPADEYIPGGTALSGIQFDAQLLFQVGLQLANETKFPKWYDTSEFKAARDQ
mgnify:CR=1 FL=1|tara:strand:+ start:72348 stop:73970 length:1623 start_codon:yes stop_codon:yes gene_type:complete